MLAGGAAVCCLALLACAAGFVVGRKWPIETITRFFVPVLPDTSAGWQSFATLAEGRYEALRFQRGQELYIMGGFKNEKIQISRRVEVVDMKTGAVTTRGDMPVGLTHASALLVNDTVWIAGGFEGDHPGPATARVWRYVPADDQWLDGPPLPEPRAGGAFVASGDGFHYVGGWLPDRNTDATDHWVLLPGDSVWQSRAPLPVPRGHMAAVAIDQYLWIFGGNVGHDPIPVDRADVHRYDAWTDRWESMPPLPLSLSHAEPSTLLLSHDVLLAGGRSRPTGTQNVDGLFAMRISDGQWRNVGRLPLSMLGGIAVPWMDSIVVGLGSDIGEQPRSRRLWKGLLHNAWRPGAPMPVALGEVTAAVIGNELYVVGEGSLSTLAYDLRTGRWRVLPNGNRPAPGGHHAGEVIDGRWYLFGGFQGNSGGTVQIFDPTSSTWKLGPPMPFAAGSSASAFINGKVYVAGGVVGDRTTDRLAIFDPASNAWTEGPPMPKARNHAASATDGARLFVFGGRGPGSGDANVVANGYADVQIFDPSTGQWQVSDGTANSPAPMPVGRGGGGRAVYVRGEFWVIGGETLDGPGATKLRTYNRSDIFDPRTNRWREGPRLLAARHGIFPVLWDDLLLVAGGGPEAGASASALLELLWLPPARDSANPRTAP